MLKQFTILVISLFLLSIYSFGQNPNVTVTPATNGTDLTPGSATNGWVTLNDITIAEAGNPGGRAAFSGTGTLVLTAPEDWVFNSDQGSATLTGQTNPTLTWPSNNTISISYTSNTAAREDMIISGIQVQPVDENAVEGDITGVANPVIPGIVNGTTSFGTLSLDPLDPLPVELSSFKAVPSKNGITLNWVTKTEIKNHGFEVERKVKNNWQSLGFVQGAGNSNSDKAYSFIDKDALYGTFTYRLKQIDTDGTFEYSDEIEVKAGSKPSVIAVSNFPNPFNPETVIRYQLPEAAHVKLAVYDILGQQVALLANDFMEEGIYQVKFDAKSNGLSSGIYIYTLEAGNTKITQKMILNK
jgi:hypothetical protein